MYEELVKALRVCVLSTPCECCPYYDPDGPTEKCATLNIAAADAIEELLKAAKKMQTWIFLNTADEQKAYDECGLSDEMNAASATIAACKRRSPQCTKSLKYGTGGPSMKIKLDPGATLPTRAHDTDAGLDLYINEQVCVRPHNYARVSTGVHVEIPAGCVGLLTSKSGLMARGVTCRGTIDQGYTGEIFPVLYNHSDVPATFCPGDKITQLVVLPCLFPELEIVDELDDTPRGAAGFGSTGR